MALTKEITTEITIDRYKNILQRDIISIVEDGKILTETYHRSSYMPGTDVTNAHQMVKDHSAIAWTPDVIAATKARIAAEAKL